MRRVGLRRAKSQVFLLASPMHFSSAKRMGLEREVGLLKCDVGNERARTRSAWANYERMAAGHARLLEENRSLRARNSELEGELARKDALIERLNARLSRGSENSPLPSSSQLRSHFSPSIASVPNHTPTCQSPFPQVITHKEWLPQPQEPSESYMQIARGLRINRHSRA